jgi:flagellar biosynthesis protein FlhF
MKDPNAMKIKSYFAKTVDEAISKARIELGSEALLLNTRKITEAGAGGGYEVVMGIAGATSAVPPPEIPASVPMPKSPASATIVEAGAPKPSGAVRVPAQSPEVAAEMEKLRARMDELQSLLVRSANNAWAAQRSVAEVADVYARLTAAEVDPVLSKDIADRLEAAMATDAFFLLTGPEPEGAQNRWKILKSEPGRIEQFLRAELESRVALRPRLGWNGAKDAVAAMVGPNGSGKTTSLAKLALAASAQRPVRIISLDRSGTGAQQLLSGIATSAIAFSSVDSLEQLPELVAQARKKECVLIDTPGYSPADHPAAAKLSGALAACGEVDVHLVVPAYMKARDLRNSIERYRLFEPSKLLVTKTDETETFGTVFSEAANAGLALSFLSTGRCIRDDIRAATTDDLLALVREHRARAARVGSDHTGGHKAA